MKEKQLVLLQALQEEEQRQLRLFEALKQEEGRRRDLQGNKTLHNPSDVLVIYDSWTGNTEQIAKAIAKGLSCKAISVYHNPPAPKFLVIGTPVHFGPTEKIKEYLKNAKPDAMAIFASYGAPGRFGEWTVDRTIDSMKLPGVMCIGAFRSKGFHPILLTYPSHPDDHDLGKAEAFGRILKGSGYLPIDRLSGLGDASMNMWVNQNLPFACGIRQGIVNGMPPSEYQKDPTNLCSSGKWYGRGFNVGKRITEFI